MSTASSRSLTVSSESCDDSDLKSVNATDATGSDVVGSSPSEGILRKATDIMLPSFVLLHKREFAVGRWWQANIFS